MYESSDDVKESSIQKKQKIESSRTRGNIKKILKLQWILNDTKKQIETKKNK